MSVSRRLSRTALAGLAAAAVAAVPASASAADSFNPGLTKTSEWYDCTIEVGVVPQPITQWGAIGGTRVTCDRRHQYISAEVFLKFNGQKVTGSSASTNFINAFGFGGRILKTPAFCGGGYWQVVALITTPEHGTVAKTNGSPDYVQTPC